jgi:hypothetical protein
VAEALFYSSVLTTGAHGPHASTSALDIVIVGLDIAKTRKNLDLKTQF